jgi:hypothetical protein
MVVQPVIHLVWEMERGAVMLKLHALTNVKGYFP